jgi:transposase
MRPTGSVETLTRRRIDAVHRVVDDKESIGDVADDIGVHRNSLGAWIKLFRQGGDAALLVRTPPGRPPELSERQVKDILRQVVKGPLACGFETDLWTLPRLARFIKQRHGVQYDPDHLSRLVRAWGLSWQKPKIRPIERNEQVVRQWVDVEWPRIKKKSASSRRP